MTHAIEWLQQWYWSQCDGDWEHDYGVNITTLDNPGWSVQINLVGTELEERSLETRRIERTEDDWFHCWIDGHEFHAACGPANLEEVLLFFRDWAQSG